MTTETTETQPICRISSTEYAKVSLNGIGDPGLAKEKPRVLLHACCGPCATACIERLLNEGYSVTVFYYNPNITDEEEYFKRRDTLKYFIDAYNRDHPGGSEVAYIEGKYDPVTYIRKAESFKDEPEGGRRCTVCFELRLAETARMARELNMDYFTTSMTVSPHKNYAVISQCGTALGEGAGVSYLAIDFKKKNGFGRSIELSKQYGLYRQNFCGCEYARYDNRNEGKKGDREQCQN